jgi:hypothetical protein
VESPDPAIAPTRPALGARLEGLVLAARSGREAAIGQLVTELSPLLWQVARAAGPSTSDVEDVLQTVWLRLLTHPDALHTSAFVPRPDHDVVAAQLGMPRGSIGPTRGRCLAKLRALLASSAEGNPDDASRPERQTGR